MLLTLALAAAAHLSSPVPADRIVTRSPLLGHSARGRRIMLVERGDPDSPFKALIVGCVHGDEPAGIAVAERLESARFPREADVWIVENANPDGVAAGTRTNADGVDLNRNFPWRWRPSGRPGARHYSGPSALSEPESQLLAALILKLRPTISVWFHQPYAVVDESGGKLALERLFASIAGLPLRRLPRYAGGATDWQNARFPGTTAFVVELPPGPSTPALSERLVSALRRLLS